MHWSILFFFILACYVYLMLCCIFFFCLLFEIYSHSSRTPYALFSLFISSSLALISPLPFVYSCQKGGEYNFVISIWLLCTFARGEILFLVHICRGRDTPYGRCIYQEGEDIELIRKLCFVCFFFMVLWVMFSIYSLLFSLYHVCVGHA